MQLGKYLTPQLPPPPATFDVTGKVAQWPMYGNDRLGDCTFAAVGHQIQAWTAQAGKPYTPAEQVIETGYWETGSPPATTGTAGGPTDTGRYELDVLNWWRDPGLPGDQLGAFAAVTILDHNEVEAGMWLFGGLYLGIGLPITAQTQQVWDLVGDGKTGNSAPWSWGGHAVPALAYDAGAGRIKVVTWGGILEMTYRFWDVYVEEAYALLSPDWFAAGMSPTGFDQAALEADLAAISGHPSPPSPTPPTPPPGPTPADVQAKITQAVGELSKTTVGYVNHSWTTPPPGTHWQKGLALLTEAEIEAGKLVAP